MVPNGNWIWNKMNGLFGSRFGHLEQLRILNPIFEQIGRITRIKTDQTILSFWLVAWSVQRRSPVTGYSLYTSPLEKKRRAQRCHQMNRTGPFRLVLGRRRVRPYGFRMSELGWKNKENEIRNLLRRPVLRGLKLCLSTEGSATPWVTRSQSKVSEWIVFLMEEDLVTKQSANNHKIIVRIMTEFWKSIPSVETRLSRFLSVNQLIYLHYMTGYMRQRETPPSAVGRRERNIYTEIHTEIILRIRQFTLSPGLGLSVQY